MKIKLKTNSKQNDDLKIKLNVENENKIINVENLNWWLCAFDKMKFWLFVKLKIGMLKKLEMEMWILVRMGFSKKNKYKENLLRKRKKKYRLNFMLRKIKRFFYVRKKGKCLNAFSGI